MDEFDFPIGWRSWALTMGLKDLSRAWQLVLLKIQKNEAIVVLRMYYIILLLFFSCCNLDIHFTEVIDSGHSVFSVSYPVYTIKLAQRAGFG